MCQNYDKTTKIIDGQRLNVLHDGDSTKEY